MLYGALIIGQAAVDAGIVSPILIIIVAITGITSFAIPDYYLAFHCRVARFLYIILGYFVTTDASSNHKIIDSISRFYSAFFMIPSYTIS